MHTFISIAMPDYKPRTRQDHARKVLEFISELVHGNVEKQQILARNVHARFFPDEARKLEHERKLCDFHAELFTVLKKAFDHLRNPTGRARNHDRAVLQVLYTLIAAATKAENEHLIANDLGIRPRTVSRYSGVFQGILDGDNALWFTLRGIVRTHGVFGSTPPEHCEAAYSHWEDSTEPSPKKDAVVKNPKNRDDEHTIHYDYEHVEAKRANFVNNMLKTQLRE